MIDRELSAKTAYWRKEDNGIDTLVVRTQDDLTLCIKFGGHQKRIIEQKLLEIQFGEEDASA